MIIKLLQTTIGRLRIIGFLEGLSLLILVGIAVPMKYFFADASLVRLLGPMHGALFLLFLLNTASASIEGKWGFKTTALILLSCLIPFGTFYVDHRFLKHCHTDRK